jgi:hypothetical protein
LVSTRYIYHTISGFLADILQTPTDAALEESSATITALDAIMLPRGLVTTDKTKNFRFSVLLGI